MKFLDRYKGMKDPDQTYVRGETFLGPVNGTVRQALGFVGAAIGVAAAFGLIAGIIKIFGG